MDYLLTRNIKYGKKMTMLLEDQGTEVIDFPKQSICPTDLFKLLKLRKKTNYAMYAIDID